MNCPSPNIAVCVSPIFVITSLIMSVAVEFHFPILSRRQRRWCFSTRIWLDVPQLDAIWWVFASTFRFVSFFSLSLSPHRPRPPLSLLFVLTTKIMFDTVTILVALAINFFSFLFYRFFYRGRKLKPKERREKKKKYKNAGAFSTIAVVDLKTKKWSGRQRKWISSFLYFLFLFLLLLMAMEFSHFYIVFPFNFIDSSVIRLLNHLTCRW